MQRRSAHTAMPARLSLLMITLPSDAFVRAGDYRWLRRHGCYGAASRAATRGRGAARAVAQHRNTFLVQVADMYDLEALSEVPLLQPAPAVVAIADYTAGDGTVDRAGFNQAALLPRLTGLDPMGAAGAMVPVCATAGPPNPAARLTAQVLSSAG